MQNSSCPLHDGEEASADPSISIRFSFARDIFQKIAVENSSENVIFSPASIQSCIAMAFFGADGQTAEEMRGGLRFGTVSPEDIAKNFGNFIRNSFKSSSNENDVQLCLANRIYINQLEGLEIRKAFNDLAGNYFKSSVERMNFSDSAKATESINRWVEEETQNKIKNLLEPGIITADTNSILVNAIYFKGKWKMPFSVEETQKGSFANFGKNTVSVDTMGMEENVGYADLTEMQATALDLPYANSDLSMLFILPDAIDGLAELERKLAQNDFNEIAERLEIHDVNIRIPKFRVEFKVDLKNVLQKLGMRAMFNDNADFTGIFEKSVPHKISDVKHKAFIDVNEAGSEAAAATFLKMMTMSMNLNQKTFRADHPFVFAIRSPSAVYFIGHVTNL